MGITFMQIVIAIVRANSQSARDGTMGYLPDALHVNSWNGDTPMTEVEAWITAEMDALTNAGYSHVSEVTKFQTVE